MINDNILTLLDKTPNTILLSVASRVKSRRLEKNWTQKLLASRAGMPIATYRRFERTGEISLRSLIMIAFALNMEDDFETLFTTKTYQSIDDLISNSKNQERKKGRRNE